MPLPERSILEPMPPDEAAEFEGIMRAFFQAYPELLTQPLKWRNYAEVYDPNWRERHGPTSG